MYIPDEYSLQIFVIQSPLPQCILDSNFSGAEGFISEDQVYQWEFDTRILCYYLHVNRTKLLTATAEATQRRKAAPI